MLTRMTPLVARTVTTPSAPIGKIREETSLSPRAIAGAMSNTSRAQPERCRRAISILGNKIVMTGRRPLPSCSRQRAQSLPRLFVFRIEIQRGGVLAARRGHVTFFLVDVSQTEMGGRGGWIFQVGFELQVTF